MKTEKDFDLKLIKKEVVEWGESQGKSKKESEEMFEKMITDGEFKELDIKVPCLTCGIKYPLNMLEHECQEEDTWLCSYVNNSVNNKLVPKRLLSKLKEKYPLTTKEGLAFRGINFETKEDYDAFMENYKDGVLINENVTSWSLDYNQAKRFASITQKGTRKTDDEWKKAVYTLVEEKANITGYKGIVLWLDISKKMVLADISEKSISNMDEKEVILLPGKYKADIVLEIEKETGVKDWGAEFLKLVEEQ